MEPAILRIKHDLKDIKTVDRNDNIASVELQDGRPLVARACVFGPNGTPYENNRFEIDMEFSGDFPVSKLNVFSID